MDRKEVGEILKKIQAYRQGFLITEAVTQEWLRILEPYDYEDVDKELDKYFKNGDNFGRYPDVYYLIKYLKKSNEKLKSGVYYVRCQLCGKEIELIEYQNHYERCLSADYLCDMSKKYFNKTLNKEKLMVADNKTFDDYYWKFCEEVFKEMKEGFHKHILKNAMLSHNGEAIEYGIDEIEKSVNKI